ncbi:thioredoxin domain-containing protein [Cryptosporidium ubiquitum]|uniref:Thioredoxin domain-containing protein n=1 Tax=Cryptosporidium ubiquitum TaxID=857276 RepID=A0A1J4MAM8_9CRYT|nr:thioredoxin domain-containing protein [Cryptosporidium ubiquitum]OII71282.1 thioredoxin domain-containing protein [Cryptosporidium ubiquitum]
MIICLGPLCIPIWNIVLFLFALIGPLTRFFKKIFFRKDSIGEDHGGLRMINHGKILEENDLIKIGLEPHFVKESYEKILKIVQSHTFFELESINEWEICKLLGKNLELPIVIDYYADWCNPCKKISPIFNNLCKEYEGIFIKINYENHNNFCNDMGVLSLPTFHYWVLTDNSYTLVEKLERSDPKELENLLVKSKFKNIK